MRIRYGDSDVCSSDLNKIIQFGREKNILIPVNSLNARHLFGALDVIVFLHRIRTSPLEPEHADRQISGMEEKAVNEEMRRIHGIAGGRQPVCLIGHTNCTFMNDCS